MGWSQSSSKREVYSNAILHQEIRKTLNKQPNFTLKQLEKEEEQQQQKNPKNIRRKIIKIQAEINEKELKEIILKINKCKSWFFEKINKINKSLARLITKIQEKNQINKIWNEKGDVAIDNTEIKKKRIIGEYLLKLYGNKTDNLEETDRLLEKFNLLSLNQEKIGITNNPITSTEIEAVIKNKTKQNNSQSKAQDRMASQENSITHLKKS